LRERKKRQQQQKWRNNATFVAIAILVPYQKGAFKVSKKKKKKKLLLLGT